MKRMQRTTRLLAFLAIALVLVGCSTPTVVVPPTQDIPAIRTESAKTVVAKITIEAALMPTATTAATATASEPIVITATLEPSPIPSPTEAPILAATATLIPTVRPVTGGGNPPPAATKRAGPDLAQLVSQEPFDGVRFKAGNEFDGKWVFKNIGTSTWTTGYEYRFASGTNLAKANKYTLSKSVAPGETITLITDMVAPASAGRYVSNWELVNVNGDVFFKFYMVIDVD